MVTENTGKLKNSNHGGSAPNLATKEPNAVPSSPEKSKSKIKKIFGKMKRSNSGYLYEDRDKKPPQNGRSSEGSKFSSWMAANGNTTQFSEPEMPFGQWTLDTLGNELKIF